MQNAYNIRKTKRKWAKRLLLILLLLLIPLLVSSPKQMTATMVADSENGTKVLILNYHKIDNTFISLAVRPDDFDTQMKYLSENGYHTISPDELYNSLAGTGELPDNPVMITFDDGYEDNYTIMLPILEAHGMKATMYMVTNNIGQPDYLTWEELRDMQERGVEIGSHTADHEPLADQPKAWQNDQLRLSKLLMEWNGIHTVFSFSYPNGSYDEELPELLRQNNYLSAVTGDAGLNTFQTNPYLLQRVNIPHPRLGLLEFRLRLLKAQLWARFDINQHLER